MAGRINESLAAMFYEMADIHELLGDGLPWKPLAYRKAARAIAGLSKGVDEIYAGGGVAALKEIPGVGEAISGKIEEYIKTGKIRHYEELKGRLPFGLTELMKLDGVGPKRAALLHKKLGISSVAALETAARTGRLRKLEGFGDKSEQNVLEAISMMRAGAGRRPIWEVLPVAKHIVGAIKSNVAGVEKVEIAGSTRRLKETIGDIDILVTARKSAKVMDFFTSMPEVSRVLSKGGTKSAVILKSGMHVDVRVLESKCFGAALQYFTGSFEHNVALRGIALKRGFKLSEYGLFERKSNGRMIAGKTEEEVYGQLGLAWIPPELRENRGEIEASMKGKLPKLVGLKDIKGDFHVHTTWSDGLYSMEEMASAAKGLGYEYIAMSDHSQSERQAHGMKPERFQKYLKEIERVRKAAPGIAILASSEVSILPDGRLDYPVGLLNELDVVIGAVHSRFKMPPDKMTERIVAALESGMVDVLAHPTGRIIDKRKPYGVDLERVFESAGRNGVALEIDSLARLDLKDEHVRLALDMGCDLAIDTDSHDVSHLNAMEFGVGVARRGWAEKRDVVNARTLSGLKKRFDKIKI